MDRNTLTGKIFLATTKFLPEPENDFGRVGPNTNPEIINDFEFYFFLRLIFANEDQPR